MTERARRIDARWRSFAELIPVTEPHLQRQEMRRAFYGGAQAFFMMLMTDLDPGDQPTDADLAKMDDIEAELKQFAVDVSAGRA